MQKRVCRTFGTTDLFAMQNFSYQFFVYKLGVVFILRIDKPRNLILPLFPSYSY